MNTSIVFGLFALYVASISLYLVLSGRQDTLLEMLRRFWGRTLGHTFYFLANVALPLVLCVVCLGWGVRQYDPKLASHDLDSSPQLNVESYRDLRVLLQSKQSPETLEVVYGA
jgi:hypothetical protein